MGGDNNGQFIHQVNQMNSSQPFSTKTFDQIDLIWNNLKLAEISRKHGLPHLAYKYLNYVYECMKLIDARGEMLKLERFKYTYENFKQQMEFRKQPLDTYECLKKTEEEINNEDYTPWMQAELLRIVGEHYLKQGHI